LEFSFAKVGVESFVNGQGAESLVLVQIFDLSEVFFEIKLNIFRISEQLLKCNFESMLSVNLVDISVINVGQENVVLITLCVMDDCVPIWHKVASVNFKLKLTSYFYSSSIIEQFLFVVVRTFWHFLPRFVGIISKNINVSIWKRLNIPTLFVVYVGPDFTIQINIKFLSKILHRIWEQLSGLFSNHLLYLVRRQFSRVLHCFNL